MLTQDEKLEILGKARRAIAEALGAGKRNSRAVKGGEEELKGALALPGGVFVTLRQKGVLRGCIGYFQSKEPVGRVVEEVAVRAALEDPRFRPLPFFELAQTDIEVSILSPLKRIRSVDDIRVGEHGLLLELKGARGLLLPQVATEQGWTRDEFLRETSRKAGLSSDAWKDPDVRIHIFSAEVLGDDEN